MAKIDSVIVTFEYIFLGNKVIVYNKLMISKERNAMTTLLWLSRERQVHFRISQRQCYNKRCCVVNKRIFVKQQSLKVKGPRLSELYPFNQMIDFYRYGFCWTSKAEDRSVFFLSISSYISWCMCCSLHVSLAVKSGK